jgi:hypothetical protein
LIVMLDNLRVSLNCEPARASAAASRAEALRRRRRRLPPPATGQADDQVDELAALRARVELLEAILRGPGPPFSVSPDGTSVVWGGQFFTFSKGGQAQIVLALWRVCPHSMTTESLQDIACDGELSKKWRLAHVFSRWAPSEKRRVYHPAFGALIRGAGKGAYRMARPAI